MAGRVGTIGDVAEARGAQAAPPQDVPRATVWFLAVSVGLIFLNVTAPQTLIGLIAPDLALAPERAGLIGTATLLGYAAGLFFLVPLSDLVENRRLVVGMLGVAVLAAFGAGAVGTALPFFALLFTLGMACSTVQVLVPIAAAMAPEDKRGQVVGDVMSGVMVGVLLSRPIASLVADTWGWRAFYVITGFSLAAMIPSMLSRLPERRPQARGRYRDLVASLWTLLRAEPVLRRRATTAALGLGAFSVFWTAIALKLAQAPYAFDQRHIALFALVGASAAVVTPLAGRAGDRGWSRPLTITAHALTVVGFGLAAVAGLLEGTPWIALVLLGLSAIVLDVGVMTDQTLGRRAVNLLAPEARGRLNALFVGIFFLGGSAGAAVAGFAWARGGWEFVCLAGAGFGVLSLSSDLLHGRSGR